MARKFSNIDDLKRDREIEGVTGINLRISDDIFLQVRAATDANPAWRDKAPKVLKEIKRLDNDGAPDEMIKKKFAELYAEALVCGWHGGIDQDGRLKPGGPRDENGDLVPFGREACVDFLLQADDAVRAIDQHCYETRNFRIARAEKIVAEVKN
jgi:hypothetical protein